MKYKKIAFIGCGKIAHFHADVLQHLGCQITAVSARSGSPRLRPFQEKYHIKNAYESWEEMLDKDDFDALWVTASWQSIDQILLPIIEYRKACFIEKPVALSSQKIKEAITLQNQIGTHLQIGYNRRFYHHVPKIKKILSESQIRSVTIEIPESEPNDIESKKSIWIYNSSHMLDLLYALIGEYKIIKLIKKAFGSSDVPNVYNALLESNDAVPINLISNWNASANFSITFYLKDHLLKLCPVEQAILYNGFQVIEPTTDKPIRQYLPKKVDEFLAVDDNDQFKPGFLNQAKHFLGLIDTKRFSPATLKDALFITDFVENLTSLE